jgi:hypothetical protein
LNDLLRKVLPDIPAAPGKQVFARRTNEFHHARRVELMSWLQVLVQDQRVFQVTEFQAFLRSDVNQPPPGLGEIIVGPQWAEGAAAEPAPAAAAPASDGGSGGGRLSYAQAAAAPATDGGASYGGGSGFAAGAPQEIVDDGMDMGRMSFDASGEAQHAAMLEAALAAQSTSATTPLDVSYLGGTSVGTFDPHSFGAMSGGGGGMLQQPSLMAASLSSASGGSAGGAAAAAANALAPKVTLDHFHLIRVIGKGSFGKVILVRRKADNTLYAMKVLHKLNIMKRNQVEHTKTERSVLGRIDHPFIVGMKFAFQSHDKLYFVLDYCAGGELFFHLGKEGKFSEERSRLYVALLTPSHGPPPPHARAYERSAPFQERRGAHAPLSRSLVNSVAGMLPKSRWRCSTFMASMSSTATSSRRTCSLRTTATFVLRTSDSPKKASHTTSTARTPFAGLLSISRQRFSIALATAAESTGGPSVPSSTRCFAAFRLSTHEIEIACSRRFAARSFASLRRYLLAQSTSFPK